jgi:UDP-2-acetamido-3-amino-2,3-dideoxy-glucuronate N-acetyltransferase
MNDIYIHPSAIVDEGANIGENTKIWHFSHIYSSASIGNNCVIGQNVMIGPNTLIGNGVKIQNNVAIYEGVILEDEVFCGPSMNFTNVLTPRAFVERKSEFLTTRVGRGASIGANATIVCGNRIGKYAMIGAGAVVTKPVLNHALVVGNPAKHVGWVSKSGEVLDDKLVCPKTGDKYEKTNDGLSVIK